MGEMTDRELLVTLVKNLELMRAELTAFKDEVRTMFRQQSDDMQTLKNDVQMLKNEVQTLNNKFDRLERDVKETHRRTLHLETKFYESGTL
jgi:peptidoglycan hydrolase CwlO-like protein